MSIKLHFTEEDWAQRTADWTAWWNGELPRALLMRERVDPPPESAAPYPARESASFPLDMPADAVLDCYQRKLEATHWEGDAFPKWWPNFGPGILAGFLGANVHYTQETVWFDVDEPFPVGALPPVVTDAERDANPWWRRVCELTERAVARWGRELVVGYTDIGGNLDVLASLRGSQRLLTDLLDCPAEVERAARAITPLWLRYLADLDAVIRPAGRGSTPWAAIWHPAGRCYMFQCDFAYMISPRMFERFVLPDLEACANAVEGAFYHLDGKGQLPHLDMLLSIPSLRGVQWIPGDGVPPPEEWLPVLKRIRDAGKLCQLYVTEAGAQRIVQELGGKGFALCIQE